MAFDGIAVYALTQELNNYLRDGRIYKIAQPEKDELQLTIKNNNNNQFKLLISANASLPLMYITDQSKMSPMTAPNFCMLLRKHINNGRIIDISQPGLERIVDFTIQHLNELGDMCIKHLIVELMGKHSNIIFTDDGGTIIDSIKHVSSVMSSVRTVLPGKKYFIPDTMGKLNILEVDRELFFSNTFKDSTPLAKAIYTKYTGISPIIAENICYESKLDSTLPANSLEKGDMNLIWTSLCKIINSLKNNNLTLNIYEKNGEPKDFAPLSLSVYDDCNAVSYNSFSQLLRDYYSKKESYTRIRQKSSDLRKIVSTSLERENKKYNIQLKQLKDTEKKDKYKLYGELITSYAYDITPGSKSYVANNFYTNEEITIPLDPTLSAIDNANKFFEKYNKLKRTYTALIEIVKETENSINYLDSISVSLDMALDESDLKAISEELKLTGYIKSHPSKGKKERIKSKPLHFISSDGYHMYVGKNNIQNEDLTFNFATGNDWWFHAKKVAGSHVIVKSNNEELPDSTFEEAARLAAHFSKNSNSSKVEIDYIQKKHIKKVPKSLPGFVIYHTNYSMTIDSDISNIKQIN